MHLAKAPPWPPFAAQYSVVIYLGLVIARGINGVRAARLYCCMEVVGFWELSDVITAQKSINTLKLNKLNLSEPCLSGL